ncbi:hypothetical protein AAHC03_04386 [Spirometra sp. Aus1]
MAENLSSSDPPSTGFCQSFVTCLAFGYLPYCVASLVRQTLHLTAFNGSNAVTHIQSPLPASPTRVHEHYFGVRISTSHRRRFMDRSFCPPVAELVTDLIEQLTSQLKTAQEKCTDTERRLAEAAKRLDSLDSQEEQAALERNQQQRLSYELETVKKELNLRETQFNQLTQKLNQAIKESTDQTQVIQELSRQLEAAKASTQQAERDVDSARRQAAAWANEQVQQQQLRLQSEQAQRGQEAAEALKAALEARDRAQQAAAALETELTNQREAMEAQAEIIRTSEERCKTSHVQEIERLNKETQELRRALDAASNNVKSAGADESLKQEIDFLKKEVSKRDAALGKLEKDCQEKHVRKLEVLQVQLKRYEEEAANLNRVLDEQRNGMEERDRLIRQLKSENQQRTGPSPELEKLKAEHAQCAQQIQQKQQQLETLMKQLEDQAEEILTTKIEALTASLAEKNANIALIETSGSTNASTQQAVSKLQTERDQLQKQLRQLVCLSL